MLARREHTRVEMTRKLSLHSESPEQVEQLLDALAARGWLSEARFAESRANTLARKFGSRKIEHDLNRRGVSAEVVERTVEKGRAHIPQLLRHRPLHRLFDDFRRHAAAPQVMFYFAAAELARQRIRPGLGEACLRQPAARGQRVQQLVDLFG